MYLHLVSHVDGSTIGTYLRQGMPADDVVIVPVKLHNPIRQRQLLT